MTADQIFEEFICDSLADMNIFANNADFGIFVGNVQKVTKDVAQDAAQKKGKSPARTRGSPEGKTSRETENKKYALHESAETNIERALNDKSYREDIPLTTSSPSIIASQKGVSDLPMLMRASHIRENIFTEDEAKAKGLKVDEHTHYHGLGKPLFLKIISGLDDVKIAYRGTKNADDSSRRENYFLLISQYNDADGNTVNVPVYINKWGQYNRVMIQTNKIATVFGREDYSDFIQREIKKGNLVRIKNRSTQDSERTAVIAGGFVKNASVDSISQESDSVNSKSSKNGGKFSREISVDVETAEKHFGTTYKINEAGYLLTDGKLLDFSGKHDGAPGGYRTVDHRDIAEAFDWDYGDGSYSGAMVKFMREGNIRLMPETGGINLSAKPNKAQLETLDRYISNFRGEVILDIDDVNGNTVVSIEYPKHTYSKRIISDINNYFDNGTMPEQPSSLGQFRYSRELDFIDYINEEAESEARGEASNRELLANALESAATSEDEKTMLAEYKANIAEMDNNQARLAELRRQINEMQYKPSLSDPDTGEERKLSVSAFEKKAKEIARKQGLDAEDVKFKLTDDDMYIAYVGSIEDGTILETKKTPRTAEETAKLKELREEANALADKISKKDKALFDLEASIPLKNVLSRERSKAYKMAKAESKEALAEQRKRADAALEKTVKRYQEARERGIDSRRRTEMRGKIKRLVKDLNGLLLKPTKDRHIPIGLQKAVASALDAINFDTIGAEA